ncbi:hypothetical protein [Rhodoferax sp.]|uniref:hypothetical protein n=1 Tax=Rhodoferax sp. TaxID=50421 RepID=UPI002638026B|nr:hypothetical protein [Rhodoferax sp.]MDD2926461.1 hypothetical protein [Rhodoferax sp.]
MRQSPEPVASGGLKLSSRARALALVAAGIGVGSLLTACCCGQESPASQTRAAAAQPIPAVAPQADVQRSGAWLGGPEPISGKLRTGIAVYYRLLATADQATFDLVLRLEGASAEDATVRLTTSDGARLMPEGGPASWRLSAGVPSQLAVKVRVSSGDGYVHVMTGQNGRHATRSIVLNPSTAAVRGLTRRAAGASDASGEPIVRMQALPSK